MSQRQTHILSRSGSTRATMYNWGNKSLRIGDQTHVVWLDAISKICSRTYDHSSGTWSETRSVHEGCDNHANPSITADREGHVRMVYGPHGILAGDGWNHGRVKYAMSEDASDLSSWRSFDDHVTENFGYNATAATIVHMPQGTDAVVYRGGENPQSTFFQRRRSLGGWSAARELFRQEIEPQYTHQYAHILGDSEGTLYVASHFYNVGGGDNHPVSGERGRMRSYGMAIIKSRDLGETWTTLSNQAVTTPCLYHPDIAIPPFGIDRYVDSISIDSHKNIWAITCCHKPTERQLALARHDGKEWREFDLIGYLPQERMPVDAVMIVDSHDRIHAVTSAALLREEDASVGASWSDPSCEIFYLMSDDGGKHFSCEQISESDPSVPNWLPSLSKPGPFHPVEEPLLLYTQGEPGVGCKPETQSEVRAVFLN